MLARSAFGRERAESEVGYAMESFAPIGADQSTFVAALDLATTHQLQFWDALILNTAAHAGCAMLMSEDMHHGFVWRGTTVVDPFCADGAARLAAIAA